MNRLSGIGDMKASNEVHSVINLGMEGFRNLGMRESKINVSKFPNPQSLNMQGSYATASPFIMASI
jgi:hypothetical protein